MHLFFNFRQKADERISKNFLSIIIIYTFQNNFQEENNHLKCKYYYTPYIKKVKQKEPSRN